MKFRVETWDTTERCGGWVTVWESSSSGQKAPMDFFHEWINASPPHVQVRIQNKGMWPRDWETVKEWHGTKETKPMITKQRGDVKKICRPDVFRMFLGGSDGMVCDFTREEFRRIWEAGNAEFGNEAAQQLADDAADTINKVVAERHSEIAQLRSILGFRDAEIARLKEAIDKCQGRILDYTAEIARLKAKAGLHT